MEVAEDQPVGFKSYLKLLLLFKIGEMQEGLVQVCSLSLTVQCRCCPPVLSSAPPFSCTLG